MLRGRKIFKVLTPLLLAATVVAGCSSSDGATTDGTSAAGSSGAAVSGTVAEQQSSTPIKVGLLCTCSGAPGFINSSGPTRDAVQAWAKSTNAAGGIRGHQIDLIYKDDKAQPGNAVSAIKNFAGQGVVAIISVSLFDQAYAKTITELKIPVLGVFSNAGPFVTNPYFYPEGQTSSSIYDALARIGKEAGATKLGNMYCAEAPTCAESEKLLSEAGAEAGLPVAYTTAISATAPNYTAQCVAAKQAGVDGLFIGDAFDIIARVATDCARQGYSPTYLIQGAGAGPNMMKAQAIKDLWVQYADIPFFADTPAVREFNTAMDKYFPGVRQQADSFTENAMMAWVSGKILERALEKGGLTPAVEPSVDQVLDGLNSFRGETLNGLAPPLTFRQGEPHTVDCWFTGRVINGEARVMNDGKVTCKNDG